MKTIIINIDEKLNKKRVGYVLERHTGLSSTLVKRLKRIENAVTLNGKSVTMVDTVNIGDVLVVEIHDRKSQNILPVDIPLDILYEDEDIIAVNKPRSMPTHPSHNHRRDTLANGIMYHLKGKCTAFHAITRLDRDTSGVVLVAKNAFTAKLLTDDIQVGRIHKEYFAVLDGVPIEKSGTISAPIARIRQNSMLRHVSSDGKKAITQYEVEKKNNRFSLVRLIPMTGRTHQLRVHMSYIGTPIYGDGLYSAAQEGERTRLHCCKVSFCHPINKQQLTIVAPIPEDMTDLI